MTHTQQGTVIPSPVTQTSFSWNSLCATETEWWWHFDKVWPLHMITYSMLPHVKHIPKPNVNDSRIIYILDYLFLGKFPEVGINFSECLQLKQRYKNPSWVFNYNIVLCKDKLVLINSISFWLNPFVQYMYMLYTLFSWLERWVFHLSCKKAKLNF